MVSKWQRSASVTIAALSLITPMATAAISPPQRVLQPGRILSALPLNAKNIRVFPLQVSPVKLAQPATMPQQDKSAPVKTQSAMPQTPFNKPVSAYDKKTTPETPVLETIKQEQGTLYLLRIPAGSPYKVFPLMSARVLPVGSTGWNAIYPDGRGIFQINAGFFDPANQLTTSYLIQHGVIIGDPHKNPQLTQNPKLAPYLPKIYNRPEFRVYLCRNKTSQFHNRYDIAPHSAPAPDDCLLKAAVGAGPTLLPKVADVEEGFVDRTPAGRINRDPIGVFAHNARSAIGLTERGDVLIVMGAQNSMHTIGSGFTIADMANFLKSRGAIHAMALDGGSSSGIQSNGKLLYGKFNADGSPVVRAVKSILIVTP